MKNLFISAIILFSVSTSANAETILSLEADSARAGASIKVNVARGQPSPIVFKTGEIIDAIKLGDMSKNVFSFNAPIDSGNATTININQIEGIDIPLATKAQIPIIDVETIDAAGERQYYSFELHNNSAERSKIFIEPPAEPEPLPEPEPVVTTIQTSYGAASPEDVERGLEVRIKERKLNSNSDIIMAIRDYIALTQNGTAFTEALATTKVPISVIQKLAEVGQEEATKRRMMSLKTNFENL